MHRLRKTVVETMGLLFLQPLWTWLRRRLQVLMYAASSGAAPPPFMVLVILSCKIPPLPDIDLSYVYLRFCLTCPPSPLPFFIQPFKSPHSHILPTHLILRHQKTHKRHRIYEKHSCVAPLKPHSEFSGKAIFAQNILLGVISAKGTIYHCRDFPFCSLGSPHQGF